jgi:hypothetical protein
MMDLRYQTLERVMKSESNPLGAPVSSPFLSLLLMLLSSSDTLKSANQPLPLPSSITLSQHLIVHMHCNHSTQHLLPLPFLFLIIQSVVWNAG